MEWAICYKRAIQDDGSLLFPERLSQEFLDNARRTMGAYSFFNQYQNEILPDGQQVFKKEYHLNSRKTSCIIKCLKGY
jgi:hypothetical protein